MIAQLQLAGTSQRQLWQGINNDHASIVAIETFGHLAPIRGHRYDGEIVFAHGEFGDIVCIRSHFEDLPDSPWFCQDLHDFISSLDTEDGCIYKFTGSYISDSTDPDNQPFRGAVEKQELAS